MTGFYAEAAEAAMVELIRTTPDVCDRAQMFAWILGWLSGERPELVLLAIQEWRQNGA